MANCLMAFHSGKLKSRTLDPEPQKLDPRYI